MPKEVQRDFAPGDLVFAKVKGYPPWPARVNSVSADDRIPKGRVPIFFYGTYETYNVGSKDIFPYADYKDKYGKEGKRPTFNRGLYEIEHEPHIDPRSEHSSASVTNSESKAASNLKNTKPERKRKRAAPKEEAIVERNAVDRDDDKDDGDDDDNEPLSLVRQAGAAAAAAAQPPAASAKTAAPRARGRPKAAAAVCRSIDSPSASHSSVDAASTDSDVVANVGLSSCSTNEESASNDASASSVSSRSDDRHLKDKPPTKRQRLNPVGKAARGRHVTPSVKLERLSLSPSPDKKDTGSALPGSVVLSADHTSAASDVNPSTAGVKQTRLRASRLRRRQSASPVRRQAASPSASETERAGSENSSASSAKNEPSDKAAIVPKRARGRPRRTVPEVTPPPPRALKRTATAVAAETEAEEAPKRSRRAARKLPTPDAAPTSPTATKAQLGNEDGDSLSRATLDVVAPGADVGVVTTEASVPVGNAVPDSNDSPGLHCEETTVPAAEAAAPVGEAAADVATAAGSRETSAAASAAAAVQAVHPVGSGDSPSHLNSAGNMPETVVTKSCVDLANPSLNGSHDVGGISTTSHEKLHKSHHSVKRKKQSEERQVKTKTTEERLDGGSRKRAITEAEDGLAAAPEAPAVAGPKIPRVDEKKEKKRTASSDEQANLPKQEKLRAQMEKQLITIDTTIKTSLTVANKDVPKCLAAMDELSGMKLIPSVLGKHPEIVDTIRKCRKYKGDALVQQKAEHLCMKLSAAIASDKDLIELFKKRSLRDVEAKKKDPPATKHEELTGDVEHNTGQLGADPQGSEISSLEVKDVESATCEAIVVHDSNAAGVSPTFSSVQSAPTVGHPEPVACPRASSLDESVTQVVPPGDAADAAPPSSATVSARLNHDDLLKALGYLKGEHSLPQQAAKKDETSAVHFTSANDRAPSAALGAVPDDHRSVPSTKPLELTAGTASSGERELDLDSRIQQLTKMAGPLDVKIKPASHKSRHHGSGSSLSSREEHRRDDRQRKKASSRSSVASFTVERDMLRHAKAKKAADPDKVIDDDELHSLLGV